MPIAVDPDFVWWISFIDDSGGRNPFQGSSHGGNFNLGIHPGSRGSIPASTGPDSQYMDDDVIAPQTDPRIQHWPTDLSGHNQSSRLYKLFQGLRYSDYTGETLAPASAECPACTGTDEDDMMLLAEYSTDILLADYLEAQHQYFEALAMQGGHDAEVLAFVNERRAVGNQAEVTLAGQALMTELRNQREETCSWVASGCPICGAGRASIRVTVPSPPGVISRRGTIPTSSSALTARGRASRFPIRVRGESEP